MSLNRNAASAVLVRGIAVRLAAVQYSMTQTSSTAVMWLPSLRIAWAGPAGARWLRWRRPVAGLHAEGAHSVMGGALVLPSRRHRIPTSRHTLSGVFAMALTVSAAHGRPPANGGQGFPPRETPPLVSDTTASLTGRVLRGDSTPVAGAVVTVFGASDSALTGADGRFALHGVPAGAHVVIVRRLGFSAKRFAMTLTPGVAADVTITMTPFVPVLPTVTTTAEERAGYRSVGLDQRMRMGVGQFLTYDQIVRKQPEYFTDLLPQMRGIWVVGSGDEVTVTGTRGVGSCVSYVVDGVPQQLFPGESPNHLIGASEVGAIEVYSAAERPAGLGGMEEHPPPAPGTPPPQVGFDRQRCVLVVVWSRPALGLVGVPGAGGRALGDRTPANAATGTEVTRGLTTFALDPAMQAAPATDTTDLLVYATVQGNPPRPMSDTAWAEYKLHVLTVLDRFSDLPSELFLPSFSLPVPRRVSKGHPVG